MKTRTKIINNESPGGSCHGKGVSEEACNTNECPGTLSILNFHNKNVKLHHLNLWIIV